MVTRGSDKILFTSANAASMPDLFEAAYGASKMFLRWFGEALRSELKDRGVGVRVLMPGPTEKDFFHRAEMLDTKALASSGKDDPAAVAETTFAALQAGSDKVVTGLKNRVMKAVTEVLPDKAAVALHRAMSKPGSAD